MNLRRVFLTVGYSGLSPVAPGTVGSFVALFPALAVAHFVHLSTLLLLTVFVSIVAIRQISLYEQETGEHDQKEIVIDELAGMWLALSISGIGILQVVLSFAFFRLFDIWKPSYIGRIDREVPGGLGVVGDDLLAGLFAGLCSSMLAYLILKYLPF